MCLGVGTRPLNDDDSDLLKFRMTGTEERCFNCISLNISYNTKRCISFEIRNNQLIEDFHNLQKMRPYTKVQKTDFTTVLII